MSSPNNPHADFLHSRVDGPGEYARNSPSPGLNYSPSSGDAFLSGNDLFLLPPGHTTADTLDSSFVDRVLNPAHLDHGRYSPFAYNPLAPVGNFTPLHDMPPNTRTTLEGSQRPARLPNGYVDLTATPDSPPRRRKRDSSSPGPSNKRQRHVNGAAARQASTEPPKVEEVDLTDDAEPIHDILQKQRADAVKAQEKPQGTHTTFNTFNCVICMDTPTDLTATACGHLFCHTCLMEALIAGENRTGPGETKRSQCPVCRKVINRTKASDVIPLLLKKGLATQPKKKAAVASTAVAAKI
ncbi:hypothetical protein ACN47E_004339 [Coniothyrium glycines]